MAEIDSSWIKPGAEVVIYSDSRGSKANPRKTAVVRVADKSFTVEATDVRIKLDTLKSASQGGTWDSWHYAVVKPESEKARELFAQARVDKLKIKAWAAADEWIKGDKRDPAKIGAVIVAFEKYRSALGIQEGDTE